MDSFSFRKGQLYVDDLCISDLPIKSPSYLYAWSTFKQHAKQLQQLFQPISPEIHFSVKACNNPYILRKLYKIGLSMDIVSGGELDICQQASIPASKIVYAGVGKTDTEIQKAITQEIAFFSIESISEMHRIGYFTNQLNKPTKALIRLNPNVWDKQTPDKTTTGKHGGKFGIPEHLLPKLLTEAKQYPLLDICGLHIHIGSPIFSPEIYSKAITKTLSVLQSLKPYGYTLDHLDIGGGFPANYHPIHSNTPQFNSWKAFADAINPILIPWVQQGGKVILEPGRSIAANAAILICQVLYDKSPEAGQNMLVVNTGMHHLIRPAMYNAEHRILPLKLNNNYSGTWYDFPTSDLQLYDVVGPICESSDYLAFQTPLPNVSQSDSIAIFTTGAYGYTMASRYNAQALPNEYLILNNNLLDITVTI